MLKPLVCLLASTVLALALSGCASAPRQAAAPGTEAATKGVETTPFESWAVGNGTGSFYRPVGPAQGTGVRHAWPE